MSSTEFNSFKGQYTSKKAPLAKGEELARLAYSRLAGMLLHSQALPKKDKLALEAFFNLLGQSLNALDKDNGFFEECAPLFRMIISGEAPSAIDLSKIEAVSEHSASPILKEEAEIALCALNTRAFLMDFGKERHKTLNALICDFMIKKGIDNPADVWRPIGLGRKRWSNLLNRYNEPSDQAPKLTLLQVAIGLRLDFDETNELLMHQCYRLTKDETDLVFIYHIMNRIPFDREKDHPACAKREACSIRAMLIDLGLKTIPEIYD